MAIPERIGKYEIRGKLGEGATSIVYLGFDPFAEREVAVKAIFPEDQANPKIIKEIVRETGVAIGDSLIADGTAPGFTRFDAMLRHNVEAVVKALK